MALSLQSQYEQEEEAAEIISPSLYKWTLSYSVRRQSKMVFTKPNTQFQHLLYCIFKCDQKLNE